MGKHQSQYNTLRKANVTRKYGQRKEERLPMKSSELLKQYYNLDPTAFGKNARDITELQSPQTQGSNAYLLAQYIQEKGNSGDTHNPYYQDAVEFVGNYESDTCYICGGNIVDEPHVEELEHLLPIVEALQFELIIQENRKEFTKTLGKIYNTPIALGHLLEYARSHRCCNQLKSVTSFLTFDGSPPFEQPYKINENEISMLLKRIWENARSGGKSYQDKTGCNEPTLMRYIASMSKEQFIRERKQHLVQRYFEPLLEFIYEKLSHYGNGSFPLSQLVMISNQALTIDQSAWGKLGAQWSGPVISRDQLMDSLVRFANNVSYENSRGLAIFKLTKISQLSQPCLDYYNEKRKPSRSVRTTDIQGFSKFINEDYLKLTHIILKFLNHYDDIRIYHSECIFGMLYVTLFIGAQDDSFKFHEDMIPALSEMMMNVNTFCILNMCIYLVLYNVFITNRFPDMNNLKELNDLNIISIGEMSEYFGKHENFTTNVFSNMNYAIQLNSIVALNFHDMNNYANFLLNGITQVDTAIDIVEFAKHVNAADALGNFDQYAEFDDIRAVNALTQMRNRTPNLSRTPSRMRISRTPNTRSRSRRTRSRTPNTRIRSRTPNTRRRSRTPNTRTR